MLKVNDINVYYGAIHAIKGVSFEVRPGEVVTPHRGQRRGQVHHPEYGVRPAPLPDRLH